MHMQGVPGIVGPREGFGASATRREHLSPVGVCGKTAHPTDCVAQAQFNRLDGPSGQIFRNFPPPSFTSLVKP